MPTTAAQLREIVSGSETRIREEVFPKQLNTAVRTIREAADAGKRNCVVHVADPCLFLVPGLITAIEKEFPGVTVSTEPFPNYARVLVSWELTE